jgi:hypothetical protein
MWGCRAHWYKLPKPLRDAIWRAYVPGQEITKTPSQKYLAVAHLVQMWIAGDIEVRADGSVHPTQQAYEKGLVEAPTSSQEGG